MAIVNGIERYAAVDEGYQSLQQVVKIDDWVKMVTPQFLAFKILFGIFWDIILKLHSISIWPECTIWQTTLVFWWI